MSDLERYKVDDLNRRLSTDLSSVKLFKISKKYKDTLICRICQKLFSGIEKRKEIRKHIRNHFRKKTKNLRQEILIDFNQNNLISVQDAIKSTNNIENGKNYYINENGSSISSTSSKDIKRTRDRQFYDSFDIDESNNLADKDVLQRTLLPQTHTSPDNKTTSKTSNAQIKATKRIGLSGQALKLSCDICGLKLECKYLLERHVRDVHKEATFIYDRCRLCNKTKKSKRLPIFITLSSLTQHVLQQHQSHFALYSCEICKMTFYHEIGIKLHAHFSHGDGQYGVNYSGLIM